MGFFIILFSFLLLTDSMQPDPNVLSVSAEGRIELPADVIRFDINLNAEAETPEEAYNLHKKREKVLVQLLDKYEIKETDIDFQPVSISRSRYFNRPNEEVVVFQTRQLVKLTMTDFESYEKIQLGLIKHGFDNFNGSFLSSEEDAGRDEALKRAIRTAKEKADIIAKEAGVKLGAISSISYNTLEQRPVEMQSRSYMEVQDSSGGLMKFDQTIVVKSTIRVNFEIISKGD